MTFVTAIASGPDGDLWIVNRDAVFRFDGATWTQHWLPGRNLRTIAVADSRNVWVSGEGLLRYDGVAWSNAGTLTVLTFAVRNANDIWAVASPLPNGLDFGMWRWDGTSWTRQQDSYLPLAFAVLDGGEWWGTGGGVLHRRLH
jgi:hypothetical protein